MTTTLAASVQHALTLMTLIVRPPREKILVNDNSRIILRPINAARMRMNVYTGSDVKDSSSVRLDVFMRAAHDVNRIQLQSS